MPTVELYSHSQGGEIERLQIITAERARESSDF